MIDKLNNMLILNLGKRCHKSSILTFFTKSFVNTMPNSINVVGSK